MEFLHLPDAIEHRKHAATLDTPILLPEPVAHTRPCWRLEFRGKILPKPLPTREDAESYRAGLMRNGTFPEPGPYPEVVESTETYWVIEDPS